MSIPHLAPARIPVTAGLVATLLLGLLLHTAPTAGAAVPSPTGLMTLGEGPTPVFTWDRTAGATGYEIAADDDPSFSSPLFSQRTVNTSFVHVRRLPRGEVYWRVRTWSGSTQSGWSTGSVSVSSTGAPTLVSPIDVDVQPPITPPVLRWGVVEGAVKYSIEVATNETFTTPQVTGSTKSTSFVVPKAQGVGTYYWRVRAEFDGGLVTDWSLPAQYRVVELPRIRPDDALTPGAGETVQDVVMSWKPVAGAQSYELQVATDRDFNAIIDEQTKILSTRYSPPVTYPNNDYFWRVRAVNSAGEPTPWATTSMEFRRRWSDRPMPMHPADGISSPVGDPLFLEWTPVRHAMRYRVEIGSDPNFSPGSYDFCYTAQTTYTLGYRFPSGSCDVPSQGAVHYWRVLAVEPGFGTEVPSIYSPIRSFVYDSGRVQQVSPVDGATVDVPTLRWQAQRDAEKYVVTVRNAAGQTVQPPTTTHALSWTPTVRLDPAAGPFTWSVVARDVNGKTSPAYSGRTFQVTGNLPDDLAVDPLTPSVGEVSSVRFPALSWEPHPAADHYKIEIGIDGTGYMLTPGTTPVLNRKHPYPALTDDGSYFLTPGTYRWRVLAFDVDGAQLGVGPSARFTIDQLEAVTGRAIGLTGTSTLADPTTCSKQLGPVVTQDQICTGVPSTPVLRWDPVPEAAYYMVYLAEDRDLTQLVYGDSATNRNIPTTQSTVWTPNSDLRPQSLPDNQSGEAYYWYIRPCKASGQCAADPLNTDDAATNAFRKVSPTVEPVSPVPGASVQNQVSFTWRDYLATNEGEVFPAAVQGAPTSQLTAHRYRIQVFTTPTAGTPIDDQVVDQTTYTAVKDTYPEGDLWWRVQAVDAAGNGLAWSAMRRLRHESAYSNLDPTSSLATGIEAPPDLAMAPAWNQRVRGDVELRWTARHYDASWNVEIYRNDDTTGSPANRVVAASTTQAAYTWSNQLPASDQAYRWRVQRKDAKGRPGPWSDWGRFFVKGSPVTLLQPVGGYQSPDDLLLSWQPVADAASYRVEVTGTNGGTSTATTTSATAWAPTTLLRTGAYSWRVRALDASGGQLGVSPSRTFQVDGDGPQVIGYSPRGSAKPRSNFVAQFNEAVSGVSSRTMKLYQVGRRRPLGARVTVSTDGRKAVLNPRRNLRRGKKYRVVLTSAVRDNAGNSLASYTWTVSVR